MSSKNINPLPVLSEETSETNSSAITSDNKMNQSVREYLII